MNDKLITLFQAGSSKMPLFNAFTPSHERRRIFVFRKISYPVDIVNVGGRIGLSWMSAYRVEYIYLLCQWKHNPHFAHLQAVSLCMPYNSFSTDHDYRPSQHFLSHSLLTSRKKSCQCDPISFSHLNSIWNRSLDTILIRLCTWFEHSRLRPHSTRSTSMHFLQLQPDRAGN